MLTGLIEIKVKKQALSIVKIINDELIKLGYKSVSTSFINKKVDFHIYGFTSASDLKNKEEFCFLHIYNFKMAEDKRVKQLLLEYLI